MRNWTGSYPVAESTGSKVIGKVGLAPLPTFAGQPYPGQGALGGWEMLINPNSKHLSADKTFITWLAGPKGQTIIARAGLLPTNTDVREHPPISSPVFKAYAGAGVFARPTRFGHYNEISNAIYTNVNAALAGEESVSAALATIQKRMDNIAKNKGL